MMRRIVIMMALLVLVVPLSAQAQQLGLLGVYPYQWEFQCAEGSMIDVLLDAAARLRLGEETSIFIDRTRSNAPTTWLDWASELFWARDLVIDCHGYMETTGTTSGLIVEPYLDREVALDRYNTYCADFGIRNFVFLASMHAVGLSNAGIQAYVGPAASDNGIMLVYACHSAFCKDAFGWYGNPTAGGTYFGYPIAVENGVACSDRDRMTRAMACDNYEATGIENDVLTAYGRTSYQGVLSGNSRNSWNPAISCKSWDAVFESVDARGGRLTWVAVGEQTHSQYLVEGVNNIGDRPDTLAVVDGRGSDGALVRRSYGVDVPGYRYLRVREIDDLFVVTSSDWIAMDSSAGNGPDIAPGTEVEIAFRPLKSNGFGGIVDVARLQSPGGEISPLNVDPADVLVYTTTGLEPAAHRIKGLAQMTTGSDGLPLRATVLTGSGDDPVLARDAYSLVVQANRDYNAGNPIRPCREYPILVLAGSGYSGGARPFRIEDTSGAAVHGWWDSYQLIADVDGDGLPDGPVCVVPLKDYPEAEIHSQATWEFNLETSSDGIALFLDDSYGGVKSEWMQERLFEDFDDYARNRNTYVKQVMRESEYTILNPADPDELWRRARTDGAATLSTGVSEVWFTGLGTGETNWTYFMAGPELVTSPERFLAFGPSCLFGQTTLYTGPPATRGWMFASPAGGIVVGGLGQLNAGYYHDHAKLAAVMQEVIGGAAPGTLVADLGLAVTRRFLEQFPDSRSYGLGIVTVGSVAKLQGFGASAAGSTHAGGFNLRAAPGTGGLGVSFSLPRSASVSLDIFDLRGRRVAQLIDGSREAGEHSEPWQARDVPSGVYFARLAVGGDVETTKLTLVK